MLPVLLTIGPVKIYSYGFCLAIGLLAATYVIWKKAKEANFEDEEVFDAIFGVSLFGLVGARSYYVMTHWSSFKFNLGKWFLVTRYPGLAFYGALFGGILGFFYVARKRKWPFWPVADLSVLGLAIAQVMGRIGCFLNGCCGGVETDSILGVRFPGSLRRRHPTQLYEAFALLIIFFILNRVYKRYRFFSWYKGKKNEAPPGLTFNLYLIFYGLTRFMIEFLREDVVYWKGGNLSQMISLLVMLFGLLGGYWRSGREWKADWTSLVGGIDLLFINLKLRLTKKRERIR